MSGQYVAPLAARQLVVEVGGRRVIDGLDLNVAAGECLGILGRNGAGKSTLLTTLAGLRPPAQGEVLLAGTPYPQLNPRAAALQRGWLGQFQQDPFGASVLETALAGRHPHLGRWDWESAADAAKVREALSLLGLAGMEQRQVHTLSGGERQRLALAGRHPHLGRWDWESAADAAKVREALSLLGLAGMEQRQVHTLSGGERQRLALATLLVQAPGVYLLDEPLSHLDLNHQMAVLRLFSQLAHTQGAAVVMVLHEPALAHRFCDRALLIHGDGRCVQGTADETLTAAQLSELYAYRLRQISDGDQRCFIPE